MKTISACMIIKNEGDKIFNTLMSLFPHFDQVCIVDTGSTDNTKSEVNRAIQAFQLNRVRNCEVICSNFVWIDDFSAARNYAFSLATSDYVTWWDADDILSEGLKKVLFKINNEEYGDIDVFKISTVIKRDEDWKAKRWIVNDRICKRSLGLYWIYRIHEQLQFKIQPTNIKQFHDTEDVSVEAPKDYSNSHHYDFYVRLKEGGHRFTLHDYYFFLHEMIMTNNLSLWEWYERNLLEAIRTIKEFPGYLGMIYNMVSSGRNALFRAEFENLRYPILCRLTTEYTPDSRLCCWWADYFLEEEHFNKQKAIDWTVLAVVNNSVENDYEQIDPFFRFQKPVYLASRLNINLEVLKAINNLLN